MDALASGRHPAGGPYLAPPPPMPDAAHGITHHAYASGSTPHPSSLAPYPYAMRAPPLPGHSAVRGGVVLDGHSTFPGPQRTSTGAPIAVGVRPVGGTRRWQVPPPPSSSASVLTSSPFFDRVLQPSPAREDGHQESPPQNQRSPVQGSEGREAGSTPSARPLPRRTAPLLQYQIPPPVVARAHAVSAHECHQHAVHQTPNGNSSLSVYDASTSPDGGLSGCRGKTFSALDGSMMSYQPYAGAPHVQQQQQQQTPGGLSASQSARRAYQQGQYSELDLSPTPTHTAPVPGGSNPGGIGHRPWSAQGYAAAPAISGGDTSPDLLLVLPSSCGLNGMSLERQLLSADKEELVQILLELGSCNAEAATFIQSKASFFAFRHRGSSQARPSRAQRGDDASPDTQGTVATALDFDAAAAAAAGEKDDTRHPRAARRLLSGDLHESSSASLTPARLSEEADGSVNVSSVRSERATAGAAEDARSGPADGATAAAEARRLTPADRPFTATMHPCIRWYGTCRNATSCIFAATPANLCLNWVRGSCAAGAQCSGVHRLPERCPPEVRTVYALSNGRMTRQAAMSAVRTESHDRCQPASLAEAPPGNPADPLTTVCTPEDQILRRDQEHLSSCESPHPHTDRFVSSREPSEADSDALRTPIGPEPAHQDPSQAMSTPFRDYFALPAKDTEAGSHSKRSTRASAVPRRARPDTSSDADEVRRCLDDSFARAQEDVGHEKSPTETTVVLAQQPSSPVVDSPLQLSATRGDVGSGMTAPSVISHTRSRTQTPEGNPA